MLFFLICSAADKLFLYSIPCENIQGGPKKRPILFFIPKVYLTIFFPYFSGGKDSRPGRFFWHQYGSNWTIYYAAADINHRGVFCHKISSSNTAAVQETFWEEQCTWYKDNSMFGGQISGDRKRSRCPTKGRSGQHRSNHSNPTRQSNFQSFQWYLHKLFLVLLYFDQFASARSEFCKERA